MIFIDVIGASAIIRKQSVLTSGMVGATVEFRFDDAWDGLSRIAVFRNATQSIGAIIENGVAEIPHEVLEIYGIPLEIGVYGISEDNKIVIPTVWVKTNSIKSGTDPYADPNADPTLPIWAQILDLVNEITNIPPVTESDNGKFLQADGGQWTAKNLQTNETLKTEDGVLVVNTTVEIEKKNKLPVTSAAVHEAISKINKEIEDLKYVPIGITGISNNAGTKEMGAVVNDVTVSWTLNKEPVNQTLEGEAVDASARSKTFTGLELIANKAFALLVTDERGATDKASTSISFLNGVYYGVLEDGAEVDSAAILTLTRKLQGSRGITFIADAGATQQIVYAIPTRYGTPNFNVGGFDGGFAMAKTFDFTNASGYTETYDVWLSKNVGLGSTTVKVS